MKRIIFLILVLAAMLALTGCEPEVPVYTGATQVDLAEGYEFLQAQMADFGASPVYPNTTGTNDATVHLGEGVAEQWKLTASYTTPDKVDRLQAWYAGKLNTKWAKISYKITDSEERGRAWGLQNKILILAARDGDTTRLYYMERTPPK